MACPVLAEHEDAFEPAGRVVEDEFPVLERPAARLVQGVQGIARLDDEDNGKVHSLAVGCEHRAQGIVRHRVQRGNVYDDVHVGSSIENAADHEDRRRQVCW